LIIDSEIVGDPRPSRDGSVRVTVRYTLEDGRQVVRSMKVPKNGIVEDRINSFKSKIEARVIESDANSAVNNGLEIADSQAAPRKRVALAYLRRALAVGNPLTAYIMFEKFQAYKLQNGWNNSQVIDALQDAGLNRGEWNKMKARYQYLKTEENVATMQAYKALLDGDTWGRKNR